MLSMPSNSIKSRETPLTANLKVGTIIAFLSHIFIIFKVEEDNKYTEYDGSR